MDLVPDVAVCNESGRVGEGLQKERAVIGNKTRNIRVWYEGKN